MKPNKIGYIGILFLSICLIACQGSDTVEERPESTTTSYDSNIVKEIPSLRDKDLHIILYRMVEIATSRKDLDQYTDRLDELQDLVMKEHGDEIFQGYNLTDKEKERINEGSSFGYKKDKVLYDTHSHIGEEELMKEIEAQKENK